MPRLQFRQATPDDAAAVLAVKRAAIRELTGDHYADAQVDAWAPDDDALPSFEAAIESDRFTVLLAETDGETVGYGVLNGAAGRIDAAYVHPDHARDGIATSLVGQLETRAGMRDIDELDVVASLNAVPFYESLGYWRLDTEPRDIGGVDVDFTVMRKRLDADEPG
jgi:ribosomal protein S18 acetylase RimI-like enzyme